MSFQEILEKAISKAIDCGWSFEGYKDIPFEVNEDSDGHICVAQGEHDWLDYERIIYSHDFAKALWGESGITKEGLNCNADEGVYRFWQYHLQQMVIADDPIKYLGEHLD